MNESSSGVECPDHGLRDATYVCQHLVSGVRVGFNCSWDDDDPDARWPDAWCDACESVRASEGEWNDRSEAFAGVRLICDGCYQVSRQRNWRQDEAAFDKLLLEAIPALRARQDRLYAEYRLSSYSRYDWNQETCELIFSESGEARVVADMQFVGSVSTISNTWLWSWANDTILESVKHRVREVRTYGDQHRYLKLASACWTAEEVDGWEMTAIAAHLLGGVGAYRSPSDRGFSFLLLTDVHWVR